MSKNSKISWTDHTFNPWWGCTKVSAGCENCYAEGFAQRIGQDVWGPEKQRRLFGEKHWKEPLRWDRRAKKKSERKRVFCGSMCDIFETDRMNGWMNHARLRLWALIHDTPSLDWLLLTKRIENVASMVPHDWPFANVWLLVTAENQKAANERVPILLDTPAAVRGVSVEPMLEPVELFSVDGEIAVAMQRMNPRELRYPADGIDWVICGAESGPNRRPFDIAWAAELKAQCDDVGIAFFGKQGSGLYPSAPLLIDGREWHAWPA